VGRAPSCPLGPPVLRGGVWQIPTGEGEGAARIILGRPSAPPPHVGGALRGEVAGGEVGAGGHAA